ncbi:putative DNA modification/repair radical SAM protein [Allohahella sp. A8]|uniref:putative DNA modification/repair radical SAM protein n=1 Tax=Allohahella sp. A8 TaxID=3141461 RepID=UPI003A80AC21
MELIQKLAILADAAKYDVSCSSSGAGKKAAGKGKGFGSTEGMGICHSYTPDGRCISLLKILLTNFCIYECSYCVNRSSSNVARARFTVDEVVQLTVSFYKRNYIEGLFLSSGIIQSADYTMEQLLQVAKKLREEEGFHGYIHLKSIPEASQHLIDEAGKYADRLSINIELPKQDSLQQFAPEKDLHQIRSAMAKVRLKRDVTKEENIAKQKHAGSRTVKLERFVPAGQSTQMIIGADSSNDSDILATSSNLYHSYGLKRVYYSAFSPIPHASRQLPIKPPPLVRENRLYQADWLLRFYQFRVEEIVPPESGELELDIDPKLSWALRNRQHFPIDINRASQYWLLRIPGIGSRSVDRILTNRRFHALRLNDLAKMRVSLKKVQPFIIAQDYWPASSLVDSLTLKALFLPPAQQASMTLPGLNGVGEQLALFG